MRRLLITALVGAVFIATVWARAATVSTWILYIGTPGGRSLTLVSSRGDPATAGSAVYVTQSGNVVVIGTITCTDLADADFVSLPGGGSVAVTGSLYVQGVADDGQIYRIASHNDSQWNPAAMLGVATGPDDSEHCGAAAVVGPREPMRVSMWTTKTT